MTDIHDNSDTNDEYVKDQLAFLRYAEHYQYLTPEHKELIDRYASALTRWRDRAVVESDNRNALLQADLAWCLGKLRVLGHPAEHLESKYQLEQEGHTDGK